MLIVIFGFLINWLIKMDGVYMSTRYEAWKLSKSLTASINEAMYYLSNITFEMDLSSVCLLNEGFYTHLVDSLQLYKQSASKSYF